MLHTLSKTDEPSVNLIKVDTIVMEYQIESLYCQCIKVVKKSNLTLFYTSLPNQEGLSGGEVGSLDILILKAMIIETRSKKDLMRGGGLCYLHFHRTPHIHCNRFSIFCSAAHCPLSPKDQSPLEQNHFASIYKVLSR